MRQTHEGFSQLKGEDYKIRESGSPLSFFSSQSLGNNPCLWHRCTGTLKACYFSSVSVSKLSSFISPFIAS